MEKSNIKIFDKTVISFIITMVISTTLFYVLNIFVFSALDINGYYTLDSSLVFSIFFSVVVYSLIWAIVKKCKYATVISYFFIILLSIITSIKLKYTGDPILFSDINFLKNATNLTSLVSKEYVFHILKIHIIFILFLIPIVILNFKYNLEIKKNKIRFIIIIVDILIILLLFLPIKYTKDLYLRIFFDSENYKEYASYTNNYQYCLQNGIINGMYGIYLNSFFYEPEGYDENLIEQKLSSASDTHTNKIDPNNIIIFFSESFWDINQLEELKFDKGIISNFNKLKQEGKLINVISPSYGGMSENVAFEFLTGASMNYFPNGYIPVMSLYSREHTVEMPSALKVLKKNDYKSKIIFGVDYYNSEESLKKIGFDEYIELGKDATDEIVVDFLKNEIENNDGKMVYMVETFEGHMPYTIDKYENYDINIEKSNFSDEENITLRTYAQVLYNADKQLNRLYEYIKQIEEPTLLLFMGDHLPYLYTEEVGNIVDKLEYFNTEDELLNYYRKYNTQCLILANFDISQLEVPEYSGVDLILPNILNQMNVKNNTNYYKWLDSTKDCIAASNKYITLDKDGNMYYTKDLTGEMKELYEFREMVQYKYFIK